jgi:tRNA A-37 threonylcarbamoyl transferase component Bud32
MSLLHIHPEYVAQLRRHGMRHFNDFFHYAGGEVIGSHAHRDVVRIRLGDLTAYLKREYRRPWRDYLASWWAGFGLVSKSRREWRVLRSLHAMSIGCPEVIAAGETGSRAFLLLRALPTVQDLQSYLTDGNGADWVVRRQLARYLGEAVARFHEAGFSHPDLYAKHVFVDLDDRSISFIDFQRTRYRRQVRWSNRWRDLAALQVSLCESLVSERDRLACLSAYLRYFGQTDKHWLRRGLGAISQRMDHLLKRRKVQAMRRAQVIGGGVRLQYQRVVLQDDPLRGGAANLFLGAVTRRTTDTEVPPHEEPSA